MLPMKSVMLATILLLLTATLTPAEARNHIGQQATVCGLVTHTHYAQRSRGKPTFLNFGKDFTVVIWSQNRQGVPERTYREKRTCATGRIETYRGVAQMSNPDLRLEPSP